MKEMRDWGEELGVESPIGIAFPNCEVFLAGSALFSSPE